MIRYITDIDSSLSGKTCLLRIDLNTDEAVDEHNFKLCAIIPTVKFLLERNAAVVMLSHRGRFGENPPSLQHFAAPLSQLVGESVFFGTLEDLAGGFGGKVFLLENLRFYAAEEGNSPEFAKKLANFGDFYVNDAFAVSHRENASITRICENLPHFGGLRLKIELKALGEVMGATRHPLVLILGGAKIEDKLAATEGLRGRADAILLGSTASSDVRNGCIVPEDYVIGEDGRKLDIGEKTGEHYAELIASAQMVVWNGPMGLFEDERFAAGTRALWEAVLANKSARTVVGGGETVIASRLIPDFEFRILKLPNIFLSTGGGAMLAYVSGGKLPGLAALEQ